MPCKHKPSFISVMLLLNNAKYKCRRCKSVSVKFVPPNHSHTISIFVSFGITLNIEPFFLRLILFVLISYITLILIIFFFSKEKTQDGCEP